MSTSRNWRRRLLRKTPFEARATGPGPCAKGRKTHGPRPRAGIGDESQSYVPEALLAGETNHCVASVNNKIVTMPIEDALKKSEHADAFE